MSRPCLAVALVLAWFAPAPAWTAQAPPSDQLRVLFIGNSYTHMNDLPQLTARLAASARPPRTLETQFVGEGGATLKRHWEAGKALTAIRQGKWDYVVLQDQSTLGSTEPGGGVPQINDPGMLHQYARLFDAEIRKAGARTLFFLTWTRQDSPQSQLLLTSAYRSIAAELGAAVAPVGIAWQNALSQNPALVLHYSDRSHPNAAGSYLAACVFYATLFSNSPEGLNRMSLGESDAAFLQRIAWQTAKGLEAPMAAAKMSTADRPSSEARPAGAAAPAPATAEALERGRAILAAAQKAAGGLDRLRALKDISMSFSGRITMPGAESAVTGREMFIFPGITRNEFGGFVSFFDGNNGWFKGPQGVRDLTDMLKKVLRAQAVRNTFTLLRAEGEFAAQFERRENLGGAEADVVLITREGESVRLFVDAGNGTLLKKSFRGMGTAGLADLEETYSDFREVSGLRIPFRVEVKQNGGRFMEATLDAAKFNSGLVPADLAKKPQ